MYFDSRLFFIDKLQINISQKYNKKMMLLLWLNFDILSANQNNKLRNRPICTFWKSKNFNKNKQDKCLNDCHFYLGVPMLIVLELILEFRTGLPAFNRGCFLSIQVSSAG
jgi:hypothetical protein